MHFLDAAFCSLSGSRVGTAAVLYFLGDAPFYGKSTLACFRPAVAKLSDPTDHRLVTAADHKIPNDLPMKSVSEFL